MVWVTKVWYSVFNRVKLRVSSGLFPGKNNFNAGLLILIVLLGFGISTADLRANSGVINGDTKKQIENVGPTIECFKQHGFNDSVSDNARYLIITHDDFYNAVLPLADWKHKKGMMTKVVKLSETGSSIGEIRDYVVNAYNNWQVRPEYLLLVGAPNYLALPIYNYTYTDNYYTDVNNDLFNDILSGRLTVHSEAEAQTVVNKILLYERTPFMEDSTWFQNACLVVREDSNIYPPPPGDDSIYWDDIHYARDYMIDNGYQSIDTLSRLLGNNSADILHAIDSGRAFLLYRGSGVNNWWAPFDVYADNANNGEKLPIVLSITCRTIGTSSTPAGAERWLLTGTPTEPRGASGFFAATTIVTGGAHLRSAICKGFFDAVFLQRKRTFGEACEEGRRRVYDMYGEVREYRGFTTLGDPEMSIWTAVPKIIEVYHDSILYVSNTSLDVRVRMADEPVESALVCVMLYDVLYEYGYTSEHGDIVFYLDTVAPGMMDLTVTGRNLKPYEGVIEVVNDPGISEHEPKSAETQFRVSPTITRDHVSVSGIEGKVGLYNPLGQLLGEYDSNEPIDLTRNPAGIYFLKPEDENSEPEKIIRIE
jgi:hypothetical protein